MRPLPLLLVSASLALTLTTASAADLLFAWDYPADVQPAPTSFLVSYRTSTAPQRVEQFRIPNLGAASCAGVAEKVPDLTPDTICGRAPECLPPGLYMFTVQAEGDGHTSGYSNTANCEALPGCTYDCARVQLPPALQDLAEAATGPDGTATAPDPQAVAEAVETLANTPTPPATASVSTPAPTVQDVIDQVQRALGTRPKTPV